MKEGPTTKEHKHKTKKATAAILTLSDSRNMDSDDSGKLIRELLEQNGHEVKHHVVIPDSGDVLEMELRELIGSVDIIITNGGTGIAAKDITVDTVRPMYNKELSAFGTLFATLSYDDIGSAALVSRASAGIVGTTAIFSMPGSPKAVKLGMEKLILPEIGHIVKHLGS